MSVILYAEFTAKPGSESEVERLISGLAEDVRREPGNTVIFNQRLGSLIDEGESQLTWLMRFDPS